MNASDINMLVTPSIAVYVNDTGDTNMTLVTYPRSALMDFIDGLYMYLLPVIIFVGITTNMLSFFVFIGTHMRYQSSSVYLASLAISDTVFLAATFFSWLGWINIYIMHRTYLCHAVVYLTSLSSFLSVWYVVSFTVERYIVVCYPFKRQRLCTVKRAYLVVSAEAASAACLYSYGLWTTTLVDQNGTTTCDMLPKFKFFVIVMTHLDIVLTFLIPSTVIVLLNTRITFAIYKFLTNRWTFDAQARERAGSQDDSKYHACSVRESRVPETMTADERSYRSSSETSSTHHNVKFKSINKTTTCMAGTINAPQIRTTRMLIVVSAVFVILNLPSYALRLHRIILVDLERYTTSETEVRMRELFEFLYYTNFAINFFIYSLCMRTFRESTRRLCSKAVRGIGQLPHACSQRISARRRRSHQAVVCGTTERYTLPELRELNVKSNNI